jgi:hypothetical protein
MRPNDKHILIAQTQPYAAFTGAAYIDFSDQD